MRTVMRVFLLLLLGLVSYVAVESTGDLFPREPGFPPSNSEDNKRFEAQFDHDCAWVNDRIV